MFKMTIFTAAPPALMCVIHSNGITNYLTFVPVAGMDFRDQIIMMLSTS